MLKPRTERQIRTESINKMNVIGFCTAVTAFGLQVSALYLDEITVLTNIPSAIGTITSKCGWHAVYSKAIDWEVAFAGHYANDEAQTAGLLWNVLHLLAMFIALVGLLIHGMVPHNELLSIIYVTAAVVVQAACISTFYGGMSNICHQEGSVLGTSAIISTVASACYVCSALCHSIRNMEFNEVKYRIHLCLFRTSHGFWTNKNWTRFIR